MTKSIFLNPAAKFADIGQKIMKIQKNFHFVVQEVPKVATQCNAESSPAQSHPKYFFC